MFRSAASLIAKKTAIVAITGTVVLGGATLALAEIGAPPDPLTGECGSGEVLGTDGLCEVDPNAGTDPNVDPVNCDDSINAEHDDCTTPDPVNCEEPANAEHDDCTTPDPVNCEEPINAEHDDCTTGSEDDGEDVDLEEPAGEHPENHGKYVSEAAKGGGPCADLEAGSYKNHGQCVREVAQSDAGKKVADASDELIEPRDAKPKAEKAANAHAGGNGNGNGKAKKG